MVIGFVACAACGVDPVRAPWAWEVGTRPVGVLADGSIDPAWTAMVDEACEKWSLPLVAMGCADPFAGDRTSPVVLVPLDQWTIPSAGAQTRGTGIVVAGTPALEMTTQSYREILPHELGHALGLFHILAVRDPDSVMHPEADKTTPSAMDLDNAATSIGCR